MTAGVLERMTQPKPTIAEDTDQAAEVETSKGRGAARSKPTPARKPAPVKGRTIYLPETLFERILIQSHRKGLTISDYVTSLLNRHVPDYRTNQTDQAASDEAA